MKKFYDQTVRDLKREVNKKVLKVPGIEQKVLEATSNEPWGPHGTLLADIAEATRNYHEYQMIMVILWKRISDTGKNWRHVYKGLTVLEYLVANGSERVIDDIREHAYQISTLSNFQYIDSSGRDQGNNVRRKSQTLVSLVNDKERIVEVRQKAAVNREKFHPAGGMHRPGSYSGSGGYGDRYGDDRYSSRDENRYNYGYDDKYGRGGDFYSRDGERYEERYGRDSYRDDDYRGRSRSVDFQYGTRSRSSDRDRAFEDDDQYSSWGLDRKFSEQNLEGKCSEQSPGAPPSYEEAVSESRSPVRSERDGDAPVSSAPQASSPPIQSTPVQETSAAASQELGTYDEFDPRGSFSAPNISTDAGPRTAEFAAPTTSSHSEMDLIGSLADPFSADVMALVPATSGTGSEADTHANSVTAPTYTTTISSNDMNQPFEDPFGDGPFKAIPSSETITGSNESRVPPSAGTQFSSQELSAPQQDMDILAGILPPSESSSVVASQAALSASAGETGLQAANIFGNAPPQLGPTGPFTSSTPQAQTLPAQQFDSGGFHSFGRPDMAVGLQSNAIVPFGQVAQSSAAPVPSAQMATHQYGASVQASGVKFLSSQGAANQISEMVSQTPAGSGVPNSSNLGNMFPQTGANFPVTSQPNIPSSSMKPVVSQPSKDKFETKSTVWSDTLSRGLVNLNISGSKVNPLSDIGIDFDALNRKEKRMEKPSTTLVTSTITMGKAMGSGSGMGRAGAGAGALRPAPNSMVNPGMGMGGRPGVGMGMGGGPGIGMGMGTGGGPGVGMGMGNRGGYGGMGQQQMGMGMGPNMGVNSGMGMGMGSGQGSQMQRPTGLPPGANIPGGYNPMMGRGGYNQQPHGSGY